MIVGIVTGTTYDKTGGKFAIITPAFHLLDLINDKKQPLTNCKLHCGVRGESYAGFSQHRSVSRLTDRNELRNPQRQLSEPGSNKSAK